MLNQVLSTENMKSIIIGIDLSIKLQPFNYLFQLILAEYKGNCIVSCTSLTQDMEVAIFLHFPGCTASQTGLKYFDIF